MHLPFLWEFCVGLCFGRHNFMSILVLQSSWRGRESWLLCFYWPFQGDIPSFVDHFCYLCFVFVMFSYLFIVTLLLPAGKELTSWLFCMWYFIVFCHLPKWCPWSGVVLDWFGSWSLPTFLILLSFACRVTVNVMSLFLTVPRAHLQVVIVALPDHIHLI